MKNIASRTGFEEKLSCKIRRKLTSFFTSKLKQTTKLAREVNDLYTHVQDEYEGQLEMGATGSLMIVHAAGDEEDVLVLVTLETLGMQSNLVVDEGTDYFGVGRSIKKYLEERGFHVYYENQPIMRVGKYLAVGLAEVSYLTVNQTALNKKEIKNVH